MAVIIKPDELEYAAKESAIFEFALLTGKKQSGAAKQMKYDIRMLEAGRFSFPYHFHRNSEELFVILSGCAMLRTPTEFLEVHEGDVIFFEMGPVGAHQLYNHTAEPCRYLDLRTVSGMDVCEYPDSGKINILPVQEVYQTGDQVDYYQGEAQVRDKWPLSILEEPR
ncbi:MAG: hypothetical protein K0Q48_618 [Bacillota bacterium]|jgi:uncharacterized cupin superfamily protein|nr:hypothetical protein [Bacillota bacterium]